MVLSSVRLALVHLWDHIALGPTASCLLLIGMLICEPKVDNLAITALLIYHDILKLDISMNQAIVMNVSNGLKKLLKVESAHGLVKLALALK